MNTRTKEIIFTAVILLFFICLRAQNAYDKALTVGDNVPNYAFNEIMNYPAKQGKLSDFTSKLTILDFWSSSCSSCIAFFPHMQALQNKFGKDLQVVLVNTKTQVWHDNPQKINRILQIQEQHTGTSINLPIVLNATTMDAAFPFQTIPQEVWIKEGKIIGITGANEVNEDNIKAILQGKQVSLHLKKDALIDLDKTTLQEWMYGTTREQKPIFNSILIRGFIDGLNGNGIRKNDSLHPELTTGRFITNRPLFSLVYETFSNVIRVPYNQVLIEANDADRFSKIFPSDSTLYTSVYNYDITVPATTSDKILQYMQEDISRAFNIAVDTARRSINCLVIKKINSRPGSSVKDYNMEGPHKYLHHYTVKEIVESLNQYTSIPLIDNTVSDVNIDIDLPDHLDDLYDTKVARQYLERAGFVITEEEREMDVAIIKDKE